MTGEIDEHKAIAAAQAFPGLANANLADVVTTKSRTPGMNRPGKLKNQQNAMACRGI